MVFGIALASELGLASSIFYTVHHITIQTTLFLVAGLIEIRGGSTSLEKLGGLARAAPVLALMFFIPAMNLAGIPPFSGFFGKVGLAEAGVAQGSWLAYLVVAASMVTSLLTLWAIAKTWNRAFWKPRDVPDAEGDLPSESRVTAGAGAGVGSDHRHAAAVGRSTEQASGTKSGQPWADTSETPMRSLPRAMVGPTAALVVLGVAITVVAGPLFGLTTRAAHELQDRTPYISTVLSDGSGSQR